MKINCKICKKEHTVNQSVEMLEPDILFKMSKKERATRVVPYGFLYLIDKSILLTKADLFIKILERDEEYMHWIVWVKINLKDFFEMTNNLEKEYSIINGALYTHVLNYANSLETKITLSFDLNSEVILPQVNSINLDNEIGQDFKNGILLDKLNKWTQNIYHPELV